MEYLVETGYLDFDELFPLWTKCFKMSDYNGEKKFYEAVFNCNGKLFYIKHDNVIIATTIITPMRAGSNCSWFISDVCVNPDFRHKGLGKKILDHGVEYCKNLGAVFIQLNCAKELVNFYNKSNFSTSGITMKYNFK
jgi:predicted GNAT family N-acyltransferase